MKIKELQERLTDLGFPVGGIDGILGPKTTAAVKEFQRSKELTADGVIGPQTLRALGMALPAQTRFMLAPVRAHSRVLRGRAVEYAMAQVGVREQTNNSGPAVDAYLSSVGLGPGYSWCMAFVYWCMQQAAGDLSQRVPLVRTGGCMRQWNETTCYKTTTDPQPGDIFIMDLGGGAGHTGFVVGVTPTTIHTVEGNTNDNGSANGDGVYVRQRARNRIKGYIRC